MVLGQVAKGVTRRRPAASAWRCSSSSTRSTTTTSTSTSCTCGRRRRRRERPHERRPRRRRPRRGHAPVGQVGPQLRRVRHGRGARRARRRRARRGATSSTSPAPTPSATATPASSPAPTFAQALGWTGVPVSSQLRRVRVGRAGARTRRARRSSPASATSRWSIGADTTPKGFFAPVGGERTTTPTGCASACSAPPTRRTSRSTPAAAWTSTARPTDDFAHGQGEELAATGSTNPNARYRKEVTGRRRRSTARSSPTRCACSTSARRPTARAAMIVSSMDFARTSPRRDRRRAAGQGGLDRHAALPADRARAARLRHRLQRRRCRRPTGRSATRSPARAYEEAGIGPDDLEPGRGLRPLHRARARLVREHRAVRRGRGRGAAARGRHRRSAAASR